MTRTKDQIASSINVFFNEYLPTEGDCARQLWWDIVSTVQHFDDMLDGDVEIPAADHMRFATLALFEIPTNPFFIRHQLHLLPLIKFSLQGWEDATELELGAREFVLDVRKEECDDPKKLSCWHDLQISFELRNRFFDLVLYMIELEYGQAARRQATHKWMKLSREYETFDDYTEKVLAEKRPMKKG